MKKIVNTRQRIRKVESDARKLHEQIFEVFKEIVQDKVDYSVNLKNDYFYSIAYGAKLTDFFPYEIFYNDGVIELWRMKFGKLDFQIDSWETIEEFKQHFPKIIKKND